jgi:hypothetical protein
MNLMITMVSKKIKIKFNKETVKLIRELQKTTEETAEEVLVAALELYRLAVKETELGYQMGVLCNQKAIREITLHYKAFQNERT